MKAMGLWTATDWWASYGMLSAIYGMQLQGFVISIDGVSGYILIPLKDWVHIQAAKTRL